MRLIDADALRDEVLYDNTYDSHTVNYYLDVIDDAPTIDAGHVVRCADCEKYNAPVVSRDTAMCGMFGCLVEPDDYCSYGKRRAE